MLPGQHHLRWLLVLGQQFLLSLRHASAEPSYAHAGALGIALFALVGRILATSAMPELGPMPSLVIAVWILLALTVSELSKVLWQIWYYRTGA